MRWMGLLSGVLMALATGCSGAGGWIERRPETVVVGFYCSAGLEEQEVEGILAAQLTAKHADFIARLGPEFGTKKKWVVRWPYPREATPVTRSSYGYGYSFERGALHMTVIETEEPMPENSPAYRWLMDDLSQTRKPWKVVVMLRPIFSFDPVHVDRDRLAVADLMAREGVALAIATGGAGYSRSARIGASLRESVHYAVFSPVAAASPSPGGASPQPEWVMCAVAGNYCGALEARKGRLRWSVFDPQGRLVDLLQVLPAVPAEPTAPATPGRASASGKASAPTADEVKVFTTSEVLAGERDQETGAGNEKK